jgi:hypothetical protein
MMPTALLFMFGIPLGVVAFALLCGWAQGDLPASAIEARSDATPKSGAAEGESAGPKDDAQ